MTFLKKQAVVLVLSCTSAVWMHAQEKKQDDNPLRSEVLAPPNSVRISATLGGAYFVDEALVKRHTALKERLRQVREQISMGTASGAAAMKALEKIESESKQIRKVLAEKKVLVTAFKAFRQKSEQVFPLGKEQLVVITGDDVTVRGWDGPGIKCVIEKIILAKEQPAEKEFDAIKVVHELREADEMVGVTDAKREQQEAEYYASEAGKKLTDKQKAARKQWIGRIRRGYENYSAFQGRKLNTLKLVGLKGQEGNRNLSVRIQSPGGGSTFSSQWQRHAKMTVYLPDCKSLAVRGCLKGLDIRSIRCDLLLTTQGSSDRNYEGVFTVRGVKGNVTIDQAPVRILTVVTGNVHFISTDEFVNSGTHHENNTRTYSPYPTHQTRIANIGGNLTGRFLRTNLQLKSIKGQIDVTNDFGSTELDAGQVDAKASHRVISQSGKITLSGKTDTIKSTPIYAYTQCGRIHTNTRRNELDEISFSGEHPTRSWTGFVTPSKERFDFGRLERPRQILSNQKRSAGIDLISHGGVITIMKTEQPSD